uniref:FAD-dependent urate hydroxylase HpyO/Asp monooxygenase CreE-like FAD/NAD(P)-binding domain-containing protein n=1 Tax=Plectus sambesii TaxID=2011161 RepID=A0A914XCN6_9BILA
MPTQIAVIGGGAGGVAMCLKLYDQISQKIVNNNSGEVVAEITVFEKAAVVGPGLPYSSPYKCHMLNFPKKIMMGVFDSTALDNAAEPDNGSVEERETIYNSYQETVFPPRHLYGEFLANRAEQVQKAAKKIGVVINFRKGTEVLNVKKLSENQLQLETSTEETFIANYVVLATGHMESSRYRELKGSKGYHHNPFDAKKALESFDPKKDVVIIGTRKTAID